jgi:hypothetical protein
LKTAIGGLSGPPPHPRPDEYRQLIYAMALWLDERDLKRVQWLCEAAGAKFHFDSLFAGLAGK